MSTAFAPAKETDILREILLYLKYRGRFCWRVNTTGIWHPERRCFLKPYNITPGTSDLFVLDSGRLYAIEVKSRTGKQSDDQKIFEENTKKNGGVYVLARCVQDVIDAGL